MLQHLQRLRATYSAAVVADGRQLQPAAAVGDSPPSSSVLPGADSGLDIEAMACELLAAGYLIQVRDGAQQQERAKNTRSCLQNLRHRFIVCLGWRSSVDGEPEYLPEPLVVEPRFREQFAIAHPTTQYQELLQVCILLNRHLLARHLSARSKPCLIDCHVYLDTLPMALTWGMITRTLGVC